MDRPDRVRPGRTDLEIALATADMAPGPAIVAGGPDRDTSGSTTTAPAGGRSGGWAPVAGASIGALTDLVTFAVDLVGRGRVLPDLLDHPIEARWRPVLWADDAMTFEALWRAVPGVACCAGDWSTEEAVRAALDHQVDALVRARLGDRPIVAEGQVSQDGTVRSWLAALTGPDPILRERPKPPAMAPAAPPLITRPAPTPATTAPAAARPVDTPAASAPTAADTPSAAATAAANGSAARGPAETADTRPTLTTPAPTPAPTAPATAQAAGTPSAASATSDGSAAHEPTGTASDTGPTLTTTPAPTPAATASAPPAVDNPLAADNLLAADNYWRWTLHQRRRTPHGLW